MARYDLTDFEWSFIEPILPRKSRGVPRVDDRRVLNGIFWVLRSGGALGGPAGALRSADDLLQPLSAMGQSRYLGPDNGHGNRGLRRRRSDDRRHQRARPPFGGDFIKAIQIDLWGVREAD